jgi:radical SAM-linked protein
MRLRVEYSAGPELKFLANLDMMHLMERALRRAGIPYHLSEGFNPHIRLSMGTVLRLGCGASRNTLILIWRQWTSRSLSAV